MILTLKTTTFSLTDFLFKFLQTFYKNKRNYQTF